MVRIALFVFAALAVLLTACDGGDDEQSTPTQEAEPTTQSTQTPTLSVPVAGVEPRSGPPGTEITVSGTNWPPGVLVEVTAQLPAGVNAEPYATTTTDQGGNFSVTFRLETTPDGGDLEVGGYTIIAEYQNLFVGIPFLVETRRPVQEGGPSG